MDDSTNPAPGASYGLETIDVPHGHAESDPRPSGRAQRISGGVVTGQSFQTDAVDPRIVIDSTQLLAHKSDGSQTFKIDVTTGTVTIMAGGSAGTGIVFTDPATGNTVASLWYGTDALAPGVHLYASDDITLLASQDGTFNTAPQAGVSYNNAGQIAMFAANAAFANQPGIVVEAITPKITVDPVGGEEVTFRGGHVITGGGAATGERHHYNTIAAFTCTFGVRTTAAGAGQNCGAYTQYRLRRGSAAGTDVTPGAFTLTTVINNTNANTISISRVRSESAMLNVFSVAAGLVDYGVVATAS